MIQIITQKVKLPPLSKQRFQKNCNDTGAKWWVTDTQNKNRIVYKGKYEETCIACHNLNKKHYLNHKP